MKVGDLIQVREEIPFGPPVGAVGIVEFTQMQKVCLEGGIAGKSPEDGGPVYGQELCVVAMFGTKSHRLSFFDHYDLVGEAA